MPTRRRQRFVHAQAAWMLAVLLVLAVLGSLSYDRFFVLSLIGLLVVIELTAPFNVTPRWRSRLKWLVVLGLLGFAYIVIRRILEILPWGVI
jgi:dolichyl-phosphate-mannose--protein O-mannosyl transferase